MFQEFISALAFVLPSGLTKLLFQLAGHEVGKNAHLSLFSYIHAHEIKIGNDVDIRPLVFIRVGSLHVGHNSIISFGAQIKGRKGFFTKLKRKLK